MKKLDGEIAIVTAALIGIGFASAYTLAMNEALVYIAGIEGEDSIEKILMNGGQAKFIYFNAKERDSYFKMIDTVYENEEKIDILVNNYGATNTELDKNLVGVDTDAFFDILKSNIESVYLTNKRTVPYMIKNGGGSIINISSVGSIIPYLSRMAYFVSKSAIDSLTQNITLQYVKQNIRCNAVLLGLIKTKAALNNMSIYFRESFLKHVPLHRVGNPQDIANTVLYYTSDESNYITGFMK
ncbi:SDR family NAD(P)-dependent oxidoreductase [Clostridium perfringens]|uniref:SDR family NAD(P)-dependent oxidoreductase n=1 Tax=Clostridium perfringens TaxID=1502 RepID=UPI0024BD0F1C|nr:SDR family oxidoreductase [Clostridium perfringens]